MYKEQEIGAIVILRSNRKITGILILFLLVILPLSVFISIQGKNFVISDFEGEWTATRLNLDVKGTFTGVVQIENKVDQSTLIMLAYKTKIVGFSPNSSGTINWVVNTGTAFIWCIIPNSLEEGEASGAYVSLSNGTLFALSTDGNITWSKNISNKSLSSLELVEDVAEGYLVVTGGDGRRVFWLNSSGSIKTNITIDSEITLMKTKGQYVVFGTRSGECYAYKSTTLLWNKSLSEYPCLAIAFSKNFVIVYNYANNIKFLDLVTGTEQFQFEFGVVVLDFLHVNPDDENQLYIALTSGELVFFNLKSMDIEWNNYQLYPSMIEFFEFTGDSYTDLILGTSKGELVLLNQTNGLIIKSQEIILGHVDIMGILGLNYNVDNITDLLVFSLTGEVWIVTGLDLTPPRIVNLAFDKVSYNSYRISLNASEEVQLEIEYGIDRFEQTISKPEFLTSHVLYLTDLKSNTEYKIQIIIWDRTGNSRKSDVLILSTSSPPPPYFLIFVALLVTLVVGSMGLGMVKYRRHQRKVAYSKALLAQKQNNFPEAIRLFHKANAGDEIVELVKTILRDPSLAEEVGQIMQMKEVENYLDSVQEIIKEAKDSM
ncbi:MAG: hypothetical protein ACTSR2_05960 [Candidatus Hodarchaeales archaeon]